MSILASPGQTFCLEHVNSIYDVLVREIYLIGPGQGLVQVSLESPSAGVFEYHWYGPSSADEWGLRPLGQVKLLSSEYGRHRLIMGGRTIDLDELAEPGRPVLLELINP